MPLVVLVWQLAVASTKENTRKHSSPWTGACWGCKCHSYHAENLRAPQARSRCEWSHSLSATLEQKQLSTPGTSLDGHWMGWEAESVPGLSCVSTANQLKATFRATRNGLNATGMPNEPTTALALILRSCRMTCFPFFLIFAPKCHSTTDRENNVIDHLHKGKEWR